MKLDVNQISKTYHKQTALSNINISFESGKIYGLLGRNGAGKSTLLNIINNRIFPTSGSVTLDSQPILDNEQLLNHIYLMSEDNLFPPTMKVKEIFSISERFYGSFDWKLAHKMAKDFDLTLTLTFKKLSTGYRSITKLITALCVPCDFIFLDEPVLGLDAAHRDLFYQFLVESYEERQRAFIISTHLIDEITTLLEEIIIIDRGRVKIISDTESLLHKNFALSGPKEILTELTKNLNVIGYEELGNYVTFYISDELPSALPDSISIHSLKLQDYFIQLTHRK